MILAYLTYFQIFASMFAGVLLFFFPELFTYKQFAQFVAYISAITLAFYLFQLKNFYKSFLTFSFVFVSVLFLYSYTASLYNEHVEKYDSFKLVLEGQIFPTILCAIVVSHKEKVKNKIKKLVPVISLLFTIISFYGVFFPASQTSAGLALDDNGLSYQKSSYMAAYASAFSSYYLICFKKIRWSLFFRSYFSRIIVLLSIVVNIVTILVSGGRGGLLLFIAQLFFSIYVFGKNIKGVKRIMGLSSLFLLFILFLPAIVSYAESVDVETSGFSRIVEFWEYGDDLGRDYLRAAAISSFGYKPVFGHGIGSVFYEIGSYSHNFITDALVEVGVVGSSILLLMIVIIFIRSIKRININATESLWFIIFLNGFVMSLFSGYYLAHLPLWWSVAYYYSNKLNDKKVGKF